MKLFPALLAATILAAGAARADAPGTTEPLRLLRPKPGIWEMRSVITYTGPDADHPGETAYYSCAYPGPIQSRLDFVWNQFADKLPRRFNPMRFTANTPSHAAAYHIETHTGVIAKRLKIEGGAYSHAVDIRRISDREYLFVTSSTSSRFGKWLYTRRETAHVRWVMQDYPPPDPNGKIIIPPPHGYGCSAVGKSKGRIDFDGNDAATALLTPPD